MTSIYENTGSASNAYAPDEAVCSGDGSICVGKWDGTMDNYVYFDVTFSANTCGSLGSFSFCHSAPTRTMAAGSSNFVDNNYPTQWQASVWESGTMIASVTGSAHNPVWNETDIPSLSWSTETANFSSIITDGSSPHTYQIRLSFTDLVENGASVSVVELDEFTLTGCCGSPDLSCGTQPCTLTVDSALPTACSNNLYNVDVTVSYTNPPSGDITINVGGTDYTFTPDGTSPDTYTVTGLTSDGTQDIDVSATFVGDATCTDALVDAYDAPASCSQSLCPIPALWAINEDDGHLFIVSDWTSTAGVNSTAYDWGLIQWSDDNCVTKTNINISGGSELESAAWDRITNEYYFTSNKDLGSYNAPVLLKIDVDDLVAGQQPCALVVGSISSSGQEDIESLAMDPITNELYGGSKDNGRLYKIDKTNAAIISGYPMQMTKPSPLSGNLNDSESMTFDNSGNLYVSETDDEDVYIINKTTGAGISVFDGNTAGLGLDGITWDFVNNRLIGFEDKSLSTNESLIYEITSGNGSNIVLSDTYDAGLVDIEGLELMCPVAIGCDITVDSAIPTTCNPATNTYNLAVTVTYSNPPTGNITINVGGTDYTFTPDGTSPDTYTVTGLTSDGTQDIDVSATFVGDAACTDALVDAYDAPCACNVNCDDSNCTTTDSYDTATCTCVNTPIPPPSCDDSNCTTTDSYDTATCTCVNTPIPPPSCDDSNCTTTDSYDTATCTCVNTPIPPPSCDDSNCTTTDSYDTATCTCVNTPIPPPSCDDSNCTTTDSYDTATCTCVNTPIPPPSCDDSNCMTTDSYDTATCTCVNTPIPPPSCDDSTCTTTDSYDTATCTCVNTPIPPPSCDDSNCTTTDSYDTATCTCVNTPIPPPSCDDNDCNTADVYNTATCQCENNAITPGACDDMDCTTDDSYDTAACDCVHTPITPPSCDDNDCTTTDSYDTATCACVHTPITPPSCDDNDCNTADVYNTATCQCENNAITPGACDDMDCTTDDSYDTATCACVHTPITPPSCDDNDCTTTDSYDTATCACVHTPITPPSCDDNDCNTADVYNTATCQCENNAITPGACDDMDCTTDDSYDTATCACVHTPITPPSCDDNDCNTADVYNTATCQCENNAITPGACDDMDACTADSYDAAACQCVHTPICIYSVGNQVWSDTNNNGLIDSGEAGIDGVSVYLLDATGNPIDTTVTSGGGLYLFDGLAAGDYIVSVVIPSGTESSGVNESDPNSNVDSNDNGIAVVGTTIQSGVISLGGGEPTGENPDNDPATTDTNENLTVDFGFYCLPCTLTNFGLSAIKDDQGTADTADDQWQIYANPTGTNLSSTYDVSGDLTANDLPYGSAQLVGTVPASNSFVTLSITNTSTCNVCEISDYVFEITPGTADSVDLALDKSIDKTIAQIGEQVTFTITITNEGGTDASGVAVSDVLPAGISYVSSSASQGSYDGGTGVWTVGDFLANDAPKTLTIVGTILSEGVHYNTAEISAMNETDTDSTPNNGVAGEDDIDKVCVSVPIQICDNGSQSITLFAEAGLVNVVWYKDGVQVGTGSSYIANQAGSYTYTADNGGCTTGTCCAMILEAIPCCPANVCPSVGILRR
ncbi:MAG: DUF11 domain-containing protein [Sphingobacteriales bacterium]|nr:DUF11 domain-containing protein [Sphingobacteriales bacterium]